jgi:hypothetical protein
MRRVAPLIEPPNSVLLVVGREEFTPPRSFDGKVCTGTDDCVAIGVVSVDDAPTLAAFSPAVARNDLQQVGRFILETEGTLSLRDVYNREYEAVGVDPGSVLLTIWANDDREPSELLLEVRGVSACSM